MSEPGRLYAEKLSFYTDQLQHVSAKVKRFAWYRFIAFVAIFLPLIILGWVIATLYCTLPLIVLFFVAQRYFIEGISLTGLKG